MAYTAWSVVYGEQPTAAKWNQLGQNDAGFKDGTNIDAGAITNSKLATGIDSGKLSNPYKFRAYRNAALNSPNATNAKITFDAEDYDTNNNFASGTYTVPVNGFYHFSARFSVGTSSAVAYIMIYKNGSPVGRGTLGKANAEYAGHVLSADLRLTAGDTIEIYAYTSQILAYETGSIHCYFSGFLISAT